MRLPETPGLLVEAGLGCNRAPSQAGTALLDGAGAFALHPTAAYRISLALVQAGRPREALATLQLGA